MVLLWFVSCVRGFCTDRGARARAWYRIVLSISGVGAKSLVTGWYNLCICQGRVAYRIAAGLPGGQVPVWKACQYRGRALSSTKWVVVLADIARTVG
jgi:hypothetical protein